MGLESVTVLSKIASSASSNNVEVAGRSLYRKSRDSLRKIGMSPVRDDQLQCKFLIMLMHGT